MLTSIVVANFNYARYLREAIDSALRQTYPTVEVVVVDDESTDDSRQVIESYGRAVVPVFKKNGGHASAINAGFRASRGEIVCLLDADDAFTTEKVERILAAWRAEPAACLAYHQLQTIDRDGVTKGNPWPAETRSGDLRGTVERSGGYWPRPTTSGLCFSRAYLERVLPMPTGPRIWPDPYLAAPAAFLGPIVGLRERLAFYRVHGENTILKAFPAARSRKDRQMVARRQMDQYVLEHRLLESCLSRLLPSPPAVSLDGHPEYQRARRAAGDPVSLGRLLSVVARCPTMPLAMKLRFAALIILRG